MPIVKMKYFANYLQKGLDVKDIILNNFSPYILLIAGPLYPRYRQETVCTVTVNSIYNIYNYASMRACALVSIAGRLSAA